MVVFDQQYTPFMVFMLLCFAGLMVMFYFMLRSLEELARAMRDERNDLTITLRAIEKRISQLVTLQRTDLPEGLARSGLDDSGAEGAAEADDVRGKLIPEDAAAFVAAQVLSVDDAALGADDEVRDEAHALDAAGGTCTDSEDAAAYSEALELDDQAGTSYDGEHDALFSQVVSGTLPDEDAAASVALLPEVDLPDAFVRNTLSGHDGDDEVDSAPVAGATIPSAADQIVEAERELVAATGEDFPAGEPEAEELPDMFVIDAPEAGTGGLHLFEGVFGTPSEGTSDAAYGEGAEDAPDETYEGAVLLQDDTVQDAPEEPQGAYPDRPRSAAQERADARFDDWFGDAGAEETVQEDDVILLTADEIVHDEIVHDEIVHDEVVYDETLHDEAVVSAGAVGEDVTESGGRMGSYSAEEVLDMDSALAKALAAAGISEDEAVADGSRYIADSVSAEVQEEPAMPGEEAAEFAFSGEDAAACDDAPFAFEPDNAVSVGMTAGTTGGSDDFAFSADTVETSGPDLAEAELEETLPGFFEGEEPVGVPSAVVASDREQEDNITEFIVPE